MFESFVIAEEIHCPDVQINRTCLSDTDVNIIERGST
jgi:hypothetical protein